MQTETFFVIKMPCGGYLREVYEDYDSTESNYDTTPSVLGASRLHVPSRYISDIFYHGSGLTAPKYFLYHVPPGRKSGKYYQRVEDFLRDNKGASLKLVTVKRTEAEIVSDEYCRYHTDVEVNIRTVTLDALEGYKRKIWEAEQNATT